MNVTGEPLVTTSLNVNGLEGQDPTAFRFVLRPHVYGLVIATVGDKVCVASRLGVHRFEVFYEGMANISTNVAWLYRSCFVL